MIHTVSADRESFRPVRFEPGLNIVLADRHHDSDRKDTRNGVGKSVLIDIIHYCLGSQSLFPKNASRAFAGWSFRLDLTLGSDRGTVSRSVSNRGIVTVGGALRRLLAEPETRLLSSNERAVPVETWKRILGRKLFDLPDADSSDAGVPSFRSLAPYLARRQAGAYLDAVTSVAGQPASVRNIAISYLLGLNSEFAARCEELQKRKSALRSVDQAREAGLIGHSSRTIGELEARRVQLEQEVGISASALKSFRVHPQYESLQKDADDLTETLHQLANRNFTDSALITRYREAVEEEAPPKPLSLERLYTEAGVALSSTVRRTLEEAREFHRRIVVNRRQFLEGAISDLERAVQDRNEKIRKLTESRASVMAVLESHGALAEYTQLQEQHVSMSEELEAVRRALTERKGEEEQKRKIEEERSLLAQLVRQDYDERRPAREAAIRWFNENSRALYRSPGNLIINVKPNGYEYRAVIERSTSEGIERMQIFCFDLAVLQLQRHLERGMDFLIHDSLLFDPVDARQRARALERAHEVTTEMGAQYICTLNSDMVPEGDFSPDFDYRRFVRLRLSDESPEGRLLGIHY